jgi:hypothetical protein
MELLRTDPIRPNPGRFFPVAGILDRGKKKPPPEQIAHSEEDDDDVNAETEDQEVAEEPEVHLDLRL